MLDRLKTLLGISLYDVTQDELLEMIIDITEKRLGMLLGGITPPESLDYIVLEVSVIRYNRLNSEGLAAHSVEGESLSFIDSDFFQYMRDIEAYTRTSENGAGRLRFI